MIKNTNNISLGNGYLFIGAAEANVPTTEDILGKLRGGGIEDLTGYFGCMKGDAEIEITRESLDFETGIPQGLQKQAAVRESAMFRCSLAELTLADLKKELGGGDTSSTVAGDIVTTCELTMTGTTAQYLGHVPKAANVPVVTSQDATPVTYVVTTDYTYDSTLGTITRVGGGSITDGEVVDVAYTYVSTGIEDYYVGGQSAITTYFLRFVHYRTDSKIIVCDIYKAGPSGSLTLPFKENDWNIRDFEMKAQADTTKAAGRHLLHIYQEVASA